MSKTRRATPADISRLGVELASLKARTDPTRWKAIVQGAHRRGFTVAGELSGVPDPLKPRLRSSLAAEAQRTVANAYQPAETELGSEERRVAAVDERRKADLDHYNNWLVGQREKFMESAKLADQTIQDQQGAIAKAAGEATAAQQSALMQGAQQQTGRTSDPAQSRALDFTAEAQRSSQQIANQREYSRSIIGSQTDQARTVSASMAASAVADQAKRMADTWTALGKVSDSRSKLKLQKAADITQEVARLLGDEVNKASIAGDQQALAEKLQLQSSKQAQDALNDTRAYDLKVKQFDLDKWVQEHKAEADKVKARIDWARIKATKGEGAANRELKAAIERSRAKRGAASGGPTAGQQTRSSKQYELVETVKQRIIELHAKPPKHRSMRKVLLDRGYSNAVIDVAEDLRRHNGKLSAAGRKKARALGIQSPETLWG